MTCIPVAAVVVSVYPSSPFLSSVDDHSLLHIEIITSTMLQCSCCLSLNISSSAIHHYTCIIHCLLKHNNYNTVYIITITHIHTLSHTHVHTFSHTYTYTHHTTLTCTQEHIHNHSSVATDTTIRILEDDHHQHLLIVKELSPSNHNA